MKKARVLRLVKDQREQYDLEYEAATDLEAQNIARGKCAAADAIHRLLERE